MTEAKLLKNCLVNCCSDSSIVEDIPGNEIRSIQRNEQNSETEGTKPEPKCYRTRGELGEDQILWPPEIEKGVPSFDNSLTM